MKWFFAAALVLFAPAARADLATVHLQDGTSQTVEFIGMTPAMVEGKANTRPDTPVQRFMRNQIAYVDFPTSEAWRKAEAMFQSGRFNEAIPLYRAVIEDPAVHYFPLPGNFVSLAQVRILECHRGRMDPAAVAKQAGVVRDHWLRLPPAYRVVDPVVEGWKAVSEKKWDRVISSLEEVETPGPEIFFLRGVALESLNRTEDALQEYAGAYILNFGGVSNLTKQALKRSAMLLASLKDEDRLPELQAQVKIYRDLFGEGTLWEGAPEWVVKLADEDLESLAMEIEGDFEKPESAMAESGTVVSADAASVTLPPLEDRNWILTSEARFRHIVYGVDPEATPNQLNGDVVLADNTYQFPGAGSVRLPPVDGGAVVLGFLIQFTPENADGVIFDIGTPKKGVGLYLSGSEIILAWNPEKGKALRESIGKVVVGGEVKIHILSNGKGDLSGHCNQEPFEFTVPKRSLGLKGRYSVFLGDSGNGDRSEGAADGSEHVPFKGDISFFSVGAARTGQEIGAQRRLLHDGRVVRLYPEQPAEKSPPENPGEESESG